MELSRSPERIKVWEGGRTIRARPHSLTKTAASGVRNNRRIVFEKHRTCHAVGVTSTPVFSYNPSLFLNTPSASLPAGRQVLDEKM